MCGLSSGMKCEIMPNSLYHESEEMRYNPLIHAGHVLYSLHISYIAFSFKFQHRKLKILRVYVDFALFPAAMPACILFSVLPEADPSVNNSYAGITRFRFIGYNLSHAGTPLFLRRKNRNKKFRKQKY